MTEEMRPQTGLAYFTDVHMKVQKLRVATGNRVAHLARQGRHDERARHVHDMAADIETTLEKYIAEEYQNHPAYSWVSRQKGGGMEMAAKVLGLIEGVTFKSTGRSGIEAFDSPSKLRRFAGLAPVNGKAEKLARGEKGIHYNPELRMMLWRLMGSFMKARGVWYEKYVDNDNYYMGRCDRDGIKVIPTPSGRVCPECREEKTVPRTTFNCPDCNTRLQGKAEGDGIIFRGHVVNMAKRRTIRLWLDLLLVVWRGALDLPVRSPYVERYGGHDIIDPWTMVDKPE